MRTASHKKARHMTRHPRNTIKLSFIRRKAGSAYKSSMATIKERPLMAVGTLLALSTLSGLLLWYKHNH